MTKTERRTAQLVRRWFRKIRGLPAWQVRGNFGTWLDFEFGPPHIKEQFELGQRSFSESWRKKLVPNRMRAQGSCSLWFDMCAWGLWLDGKRIAHSESSRRIIQRAARLLNGCRVTQLRISPRSKRIELVFEESLRLEFRPFSRGRAEEVLVHFYDNRNIRRVLNLRRDFQVSDTRMDAKTDNWSRCPELAIVLDS